MAESVCSLRSEEQAENTTENKPQQGKIPTDDKCPAAADDILKRINETFHQSKADQILRLLTDQDILNNRFKKCALDISVKEDNRSDTDSLSEASVKETETRLAQRLELHKQQGGRSKTSLGFYNDVDKFSSDEEDNKNNYNNNNNNNNNNETMADEDRQVINTRINRPKSSYVRRRTHAYDSDDSLDLDTEFNVKPERRAMSGRPKSRLGNRDRERDRMILRETDLNTYNPPPPPSPVRQETQEIVDMANYEKYASTRQPIRRPPTYQRQRSNVRAFCDNPENSIDSSTTVSGSTAVSRSVDTPLYHKPPTNTRKSVDIQEEQSVSPVRRHRRQQLKSARANRPTSENVFLVRQRTESRMLKSNPSAARPKSEKLLLQASSGKKQMLSIDTNPLQASQNTGFQPAPSNFQAQTQQDFKNYNNSPPRPVSRRGKTRPEVSIPPRGQNNVGVLGHGRQPIGLMKLPPLDASVSSRADRIVLQPAREACV